MDANGLRFWMLADERQWHRPGNPPTLEFDRDCRRLRLARRRQRTSTTATAPSADPAALRALLERVPQTRDRLGTRAYWDPKTGFIRATGALDDATDLWRPDQAPSDLVMGHDGVLHAAIGGSVWLWDCRGRWPTQEVSHPDCQAWRLAPHPDGGVWVLDRDRRNLWRLWGAPLAARAAAEPTEDPGRLCSCDPNPDPARLQLLASQLIPATETVVGLASSPQGRLALLSWSPSSPDVALLRLPDEGQGHGPITLLEAPDPWSLTWVSEERVALRSVAFPGEALVYALHDRNGAASLEGRRLEPLGDFYPLQNGDPEPPDPSDPWLPGPFPHGLTLPPHYPRRPESPVGPPATAPLYALALPTFARLGEAAGLGPAEAALATPPDAPMQPTCDSRQAGMVWHRLYLEAVIPAQSGIIVELAATESTEPPSSEDDWHPHHFGERFLPGDGQVPVGTWLAATSEQPFHPGVLGCPGETGRVGLFTALVQRAGRQVRRLQGRYLWLRLRLSGDGCGTPELAALRIYGSRFSYRDQYLPDLYQENLFGPDADNTVSRSTAADFLERFLCIAEGVLTPLEDRIAQVYLLSTASTVPEPALEWLASWIGVSFEPGWSPQRRRRWLELTPELYRRRGTRAGLELALDIATDGAVSRGAILVLENYRLRRTFATILGADLADEADPLLAGWAVSGNSVVGDTLILGEQARDELLALFRLPREGWRPSEQQSVAGFFERFAHRATVLVHEQLSNQDLGLIRRVVALETPAHVQTEVVTASTPLLVGVASLVGIDTLLAPGPEQKRVRLDRSQLNRALLLTPASLDPRLERGKAANTAGQPPVAGIQGPRQAELGESFVLDGSPSRAGPGHRVRRYLWKRLE